MKINVLKALANPARIFYVPYSIAVFNFAVQFLIFVTIFTVGLIVSNGNIVIDPLYFLISLCGVHFILIGISKREPQIMNIIAAKIKLFKIRVPKSLRG